MRKTITLAMIAGGFVLMLLGYLASAPWGDDSVANSDPSFSFAPAIFVLGVILALSSALVYELMADRHEG